MAGSSAAATALAFHLWETTHSSGFVAAALLAQSLVLGLASAPAGVLADRVDRKRLIIGSDIAGGACFVALAIAVWADLSPVLLVALMAVGALFESPFMAASNAAIPNLVDDADVPWLNALLARIQTVTGTVAPAAGGALAGLLGVGAVLGVNAVSFVASSLLVASIHARMNAAPAAGSDDEALGDALEEHGAPVVRVGAVRVSWADPLLRATVFPGFVGFLGVGFVLTAAPQLADAYDLGAFGYGLLTGGFSVGAFAASFVVPGLLRRFPGGEFRVAVVGFALHGVGMGIVALTEPLAFAILGSIVAGIGGGVTAPARQTIIQRRAPDAVRGSVFGLMEAIGWTSFAVSLVAAGVFVDAAGVRWAYGISALLFVAGMAMQLALRYERRHR